MSETPTAETTNHATTDPQSQVIPPETGLKEQIMNAAAKANLLAVLSMNRKDRRRFAKIARIVMPHGSNVPAHHGQCCFFADEHTDDTHSGTFATI